MNTQFYKDKADKALNVGNRRNVFIKITLVTFIIHSVFSASSNLIPDETIIGTALSVIIGTVSTFIISPLIYYAYTIPAMKVARHKDISTDDALSATYDFRRALLSNLIMAVFCFLGALCFIIPGIILYYSYSLSYFILADDPDITPYEALKKSATMMKGHRIELFKLNLSYFGWVILSILTLGIMSIWLTPRLYTATAVFYDRLKAGYKGESYKSCDYTENYSEAFEEVSPHTYYVPEEAVPTENITLQEQLTSDFTNTEEE